MRQEIINTIKKELKEYPFINAVWLEGADAHNRVDEYSDIDLWIDADDEKIDQAFDALVNCLNQFGELDLKIKQNHNDDVISQRYYHLKNTSPFLLIDVCIQKHSREMKFKVEHTDEKPLILFDKNNVIKFEQIIQSEFDITLKNRVKEIEELFLVHLPKVEKHIKRNHFLSGGEPYRHSVLEPIIELLRINSDPTKKDFGFKHIESDLPNEEITRLEKLSQYTSVDDISALLPMAEKFFYEALRKVKDKLEIE